MCEDGILAPGLKTEAITWSYAIREALALCNDLMPLNGRQIVGPDSEKRAFADVEAAFVVCADPASPSPPFLFSSPPPTPPRCFAACRVNCPHPPSCPQSTPSFPPSPAAYGMCCLFPPPAFNLDPPPPHQPTRPACFGVNSRQVVRLKNASAGW